MSAAHRSERVWDPLVRITHWSVALGIGLNGLIVEDESLAHVWIGYAVLAMVGLRLIWGVIGTREARFTAFPPDPAAALQHLRDLRSGGGEVHLSHNPLGALMVYALWVGLIGACGTGLLLESDAWWGSEAMEEAHELFANGVMIAALLHVGGVIFESRRSGVNLARAMIDGVKRIPLPCK